MGSISNAFGMIQAIVGGDNEGATFSRIVRDSGVAKSTAHRLLHELTDIGALRYDDSTRTYSGGLLLPQLGSAVMSGYDIRDRARPCLVKLHDATGHTATLGIRDGNRGVYVDRIEHREFGNRLHSEIGKSFPLHCTGIGKVMLAWSSAAERKLALAGKLESYTKNTITSKQALTQSFEQIQDCGYALDNEEITRGFVCVAAPVFGPDAQIAGALSCTLPSYLRDEHGIEKEIELVIQAAADASR